MSCKTVCYIFLLKFPKKNWKFVLSLYTENDDISQKHQ